MSKLITGIEAIRKGKELINQKETNVICTTFLPGEHTNITVYEFIGFYYLVVSTTPVHLSFFDEITKEEADNIVYNIKGLSRLGSLFEFGGF